MRCVLTYTAVCPRDRCVCSAWVCAMAPTPGLGMVQCVQEYTCTSFLAALAAGTKVASAHTGHGTRQRALCRCLCHWHTQWWNQTGRWSALLHWNNFPPPHAHKREALGRHLPLLSPHVVPVCCRSVHCSTRCISTSQDGALSKPDETSDAFFGAASPALSPSVCIPCAPPLGPSMGHSDCFRPIPA